VIGEESGKTSDVSSLSALDQIDGRHVGALTVLRTWPRIMTARQ
jgi:hypothetical protein